MRQAVGVKREHSLQRVCGSGPDELDRLLDEYENSGLSARQYASQLGMGYSTLCKWLHRARQLAGPGSSEPKVEFVPVQSPLPFGGPTYELRWPGGFSLHVGRGFDPQEVRQLLSLLPQCSR
jgi:hypothetical protein